MADQTGVIVGFDSRHGVGIGILLSGTILDFYVVALQVHDPSCDSRTVRDVVAEHGCEGLMVRVDSEFSSA